MKIRLAKKLFYKESAEYLLNEGGCIYAHISSHIVDKVVRKLEKLTKLKLIYYLHSEHEKDFFVICVKTKRIANYFLI